MDRRKFLAGLVTGAAGGAAAGVAGRVALEKRRGADTSTGKPIPEFARLSYSQQGEDIVLWHALNDLMKIDKGTFMDVGAAHPRKGNNTYLLYWTGCRGVLVEPNPMFAQMLRDERSLDIVVEAGIGVDEVKEADYYEIKGNPMLNTFSADTVKNLEKQGEAVERVRKMPLLNINNVIEKHLGKAPDLLSTDVEGMDYDILKSLDLSRFRPAVICAEDTTVRNSGARSRIAEYLTEKGYIPRGGSMVNSIYVDQKRLA
jgi:FkbM family methyltransferase